MNITSVPFSYWQGHLSSGCSSCEEATYTAGPCTGVNDTLSLFGITYTCTNIANIVSSNNDCTFGSTLCWRNCPPTGVLLRADGPRAFSTSNIIGDIKCRAGCQAENCYGKMSRTREYYSDGVCGETVLELYYDNCATFIYTFPVYIETPAVKTYPLNLDLVYSGTVYNLKAISTTGSLSGSLKINDQYISGLSGILIDTTFKTYTGINNNSFTSGSTLKFEISDLNTITPAENLWFGVYYTLY